MLLIPTIGTTKNATRDKDSTRKGIHGNWKMI